MKFYDYMGSHHPSLLTVTRYSLVILTGVAPPSRHCLPYELFLSLPNRRSNISGKPMPREILVLFYIKESESLGKVASLG